MFGKMIPDRSRSGEFFGFYDIFGKFSAIMGPALVGFVSSVMADRELAARGLTAATVTAEQLAEVNAAAAPWGVLSVLLVFFVGGGLYFFVLPRCLNKD